jgi:hypothetical protein
VALRLPCRERHSALRHQQAQPVRAERLDVLAGRVLRSAERQLQAGRQPAAFPLREEHLQAAW